jgi:putative salt-induced outer membrane protein
MNLRCSSIFPTPSLLTAAIVAVSSFAGAQKPPEGLMKRDPSTTGQTDVASETFAAAAERAAQEAENKDTTEAKISAGGLGTAGNTRAIAATTAGDFRLRRADNQVSATIAINYARTAPDGDAPMDTTVDNQQGRVRYDRFLTKRLAAFLAVSARRDRFQQLNLRLNIDPGVAYYVIDDPGQQLWGELGYDLQFDVRRQEALDAAAAEGTDIDKTEVRHSARVFVGYDNSLTEAVTLKTGIEYLQSVQETKNWRLNWDIGISSKIGGDFSLATTHSIKYDNNPLPEVGETDMVTSISLVYQLL